MELWLETLLDHEVTYTGMIAQCLKTANAWYLSAPELPEYRDGNRAVHLRTNGSSPDAVARTVIDYFRSQRQVPVADVDPIAEAQGIGAALRRFGVMPVQGDRVLLRFARQEPPQLLSNAVAIRIMPNETGKGEAAEWIETAVSDDIGWPDEALWRAVASCEARYPLCQLYLGTLGGEPAGTCDLFEHNRWGRVDSVATRPDMRRRGVASALVTCAVSDSVTRGNRTTYLFTEPGTNAERLYLRLGFERWHLNVLRRYRA